MDTGYADQNDDEPMEEQPSSTATQQPSTSQGDQSTSVSKEELSKSVSTIYHLLTTPSSTIHQQSAMSTESVSESSMQEETSTKNDDLSASAMHQQDSTTTTTTTTTTYQQPSTSSAVHAQMSISTMCQQMSMSTICNQPSTSAICQQASMSTIHQQPSTSITNNQQPSTNYQEASMSQVMRQRRVKQKPLTKKHDESSTMNHGNKSKTSSSSMLPLQPPAEPVRQEPVAASLMYGGMIVTTRPDPSPAAMQQHRLLLSIQRQLLSPSMFTDYMDDIDLLPLHPFGCEGTEEDVEKMRGILQDDPFSLERLQYPSNSSFGAHLTCKNFTPLHDACKCAHIQCIKFLIEAGANLNRIHVNGSFEFTCFDFAALHEESVTIDIMKMLIDNGAEVNCIEDNVIKPGKNVIFATAYRANNLLRFLLERGSVTETMKVLANGKLEYVPTIGPVIEAIHANNVDGYKLLLLHGASTTFVSDSPRTEFSFAHHIIRAAFPAFGVSSPLATLKVFHSFGGNLWATERNATALEYLRNEPFKMTHFPNLATELEKLMSRPHTLKSFCRMKLHSMMGRDYWRKSQELNLPDNIKEYLHYEIGPSPF